MANGNPEDTEQGEQQPQVLQPNDEEHEEDNGNEDDEIGTALGSLGIGLLALYFLVLISVTLMILFEAVPAEIPKHVDNATASTMVSYTSAPNLILARIISTPISLDIHLMLIVIFGGALGGIIHGLGSLTHWTVHHRDKLEQNRILWYIIRPFMGGALALAAYVAFRAGVISPDTLDVLNPYGVITIAIVVGLVEQRALSRIRDVVNALLGIQNNTTHTNQSNHPQDD